jgi:large subunit ribosomal protein L21
MYAVVSTGGRQYRVEPGVTLSVERMTAEPGASVTFDRVLLVGDDETVTVGTPVVSGASVSATVLGEVLGPKLVIFKFKQKVKYRRRTGHRQHLTQVRIDAINTATKARTEPKPAAAAAGDEESAAKPKPRRRAAAKAESAVPVAPKPRRARTKKAAEAAEE